MSIFDIFTNAAAEDAAAKNAALYQQYGGQATGILGNYGTQAGNIYGAYGAQAIPLYQNLNTIGQGYLTDAAAQAREALRAGTTGAEQQYAGAKEAAQNAIGAYAPLSALGTKYGQATTLYQDALGINGPEGVARAQAAFTTGPGYQFQVNQATDAAARKAASLGLAGSGTALDEIRNRAQGIASQEYGDYLSRLGGFVNPELQATSGAATGTAQGYRTLADIYGSQAGLYPAQATREAALLSELGQNRLGLASSTTGAQAGILGNVAQGQAGILGNVAQGQTNVLGNVTGGLASANQQAAQAAQQGSATFWNALANLGGAAAKGYFGGNFGRTAYA